MIEIPSVVPPMMPTLVKEPLLVPRWNEHRPNIKIKSKEARRHHLQVKAFSPVI
jgi:hypothetical protein